MTPTDRLKARLTSIADAIRERTGETDKLTIEQMKAEIEYMPAGDDGETYILVDENGNEIPAVLTEEEVDLTANVNDIREGVIAITDDGVVTGEKFIPPYYTSVGFRGVPNGSIYEIPLSIRDAYDYTSLQCIICPFNTSMDESVAAEKVVIYDKVYPVNSNTALSTVTKDTEKKSVKLGLTNETGKLNIVRYFTYKEEE